MLFHQYNYKHNKGMLLIGDNKKQTIQLKVRSMYLNRLIIHKAKQIIVIKCAVVVVAVH